MITTGSWKSYTPRPTSGLSQPTLSNSTASYLRSRQRPGKARLQVDSARDATQAEVEVLRRENERLKQLVAELSLQVHLLKKTVVLCLD